MPREFDFYPLEERILLSGEGLDVSESLSEVNLDLVATLLQQFNDADGTVVDPMTLNAPQASENDNTSGTESTHTIVDAPGFDPASPIEVVFVDSRVEDADTLLADLRDSAEDQTQWLIIQLDSDRDGIEQISETMASLTGVDAIHLLSHGDGESIQLGSTRLDAQTSQTYVSGIARWGLSLDADADILIYGCDLASTESGRELIQQIAAVCDCDVAASDDATGHTELGGDWVLEYSVGDVTTEVFVGIRAQEYWHGLLDLNASGGETLVNQVTINTQATTPNGGGNVAMDDSGNYVVAWQDGRSGNNDVWAAVYHADGSVKVSEFKVHSNQSSNQEWANVGMADNGNFAVTWSDNRSGTYETYMRLYNSAGTAITGETLVSTLSGAQDYSAIDFASDGSFVVTFDNASNSDIYFQRFNSSGVAQGSNTKANTYTSSTQVSPEIAVADNGSFVIVWESNGQDGSGYGVYGQRFNANGTTSGSEFRANTTISGNQWLPSVAAASDGSFVVSWESSNQDGSGYGIYAQRFDATATKLGGEILVNTFTSGDQTSSHIDLNSDGDFIVTWRSSSQDGSGYGVYVQHFDSDGIRMGGETLVNSTTSGNQTDPSVAYSGSKAVVVWSGQGTGDTTGIFSQRLDTFNTATGTNSAPTVVDSSVNATEDIPFVFSASDFGYSDLDGDPLSKIQVVDLPTLGQLKLNGTLVTLNQEISRADIDSGLLTFTTAQNANGVGYDNFQYRVHDGTEYSDYATITPQLTGTFDANADGFVYTDIVNGGFADGTYNGTGGSSGGGLRIDLGSAITSGTTSGGWSNTFTLTETTEITISTDYRLRMSSEYELNEYGELLLQVNGTPYGTDTNTSLIHQVGDGNGGAVFDSGWQSYQTTIMLGPGTHTLSLVATNNDSTTTDEWVEGYFDNVSVTSGQHAVMTVTVDPVNDAPVITGGPDTLGLTETDAGLTGSGSFTVSDVDTTDNVTAAVDSVTVGGTGSGSVPVGLDNSTLKSFLSVTPTAILDGTENSATLAWNFNSGSEAFNFLATGQTLILTYTVSATDDDGTPLSDTETVTVTITGTNDAPVIDSNGGGPTAAISVDENTTAVTTVTSTDIDSTAATYTISGVDAGLFSIGGTSGILTFTAARDYEAPLDFDGDNVYEVTVQVSDGAGGTDTQAISVTLQNIIDTSFDGPSTLIFSESGGTTPQASDFNGTDFSIAVGTSNIDGPWRVLAGSESPDRDEKIVVGVDAAGNLSGQMWDGSSWTAFTFNDFATVSDSTKHGFAVQYESLSGDAILVWNNGTTGTSGASYKVWNGITWSATNTITTPVSGEPSQLQLATAPDSDELVLVGSNASNQDFAIVWDGDNWGNAQTLSTIAGASNTEIAVVYEQQSGDAMVVYGDNTSSAHYRIWNGTTWGAQQDLTPPGGVTGQVTWSSVASDPTSDRIAFSAHTANNETWLAVWNGSSWGDKLLASTSESNNTFRSVAVAFESQSGDLLAVYTENDNRFSYRTWANGSGWSAEASGVDLGDKVRTITLTSRPETNQIMLTALDAGGDINSPLWDGRSWSERNEVENNSGETTTQPFLFLWDENLAYLTAAANDTAFWFSTDGDVNSKGAAGLNSWTSGEIIALGDPNLKLEPVDGITTATATSVFNLDNFGGDTKIDALHYVGANIQVGSSNFNLLAGDILFSTQDAETLVSTNTLTVANSDIIVFRADSVGDYSSGRFYVLLENPTGQDLNSISLVEKNTVVGDTTLQAGDFLMSTGTSLLLYETTNVGAGTTSGTVRTLLDGSDTNVKFSENINGVELYESDTVIGGHTILAGTILVSIDKDTNVGSNSLSIKKHDLVALSVTQTTLVAGSGNGAVTAQLIMDGSDIGLTAGAEKISGFTAIPNNQAPTDIAPNSMSVDENTDTSSGYSVGTLTATDVDAGETFAYSIVGGTDAAKFSIGGGSNNELVLTDGTLDFESQSSYSVTVRVTDSASNVYEETLTVSVNDLNEAPVITGGPDTAGLTETDSGLTSSGTLTVTDQDISDWVTANVDSVGISGTGSGNVPLSLTNTISKGFLSVSPTAILDNTETTNTLTWNFNSGSEAFNFLATGETLVLTYTVSATDDDGTPLSDTETVTITITGTNDQPTITVVDVTGAVTEDATAPNLTDSGSVTFAEADETDLINSSVALSSTTTTGPTIPSGLATALASSVSLTQTGTNDGSIAWD
ncbi:DUF4347 domain-containing protein, partial [Novipirellula rosea]|uniref:DUF4347 domain-containing protein n=1 Tax=Novipirellula rosea TaxID=1031540 RepID=UPI0031EEA301